MPITKEELFKAVQVKGFGCLIQPNLQASLEVIMDLDTEALMGGLDKAQADKLLENAAQAGGGNYAALLSKMNILAITQQSGMTLLTWAIHHNQDKVVSAITNSQYCNEDVLNVTYKDGRNALHEAIFTGKTASAKAILASQHCTAKVLVNENGVNALDLAVAKGNIEVVEAILANPYCATEPILSLMPKILLTAVKSDITNLVLASRHCSNEIIQQAIANLRVPFSASRGPLAWLYAIMTQPKELVTAQLANLEHFAERSAVHAISVLKCYIAIRHALPEGRSAKLFGKSLGHAKATKIQAAEALYAVLNGDAEPASLQEHSAALKEGTLGMISRLNNNALQKRHLEVRPMAPAIGSSPNDGGLNIFK